jgi:hypothetical protein
MRLFLAALALALFPLAAMAQSPCPVLAFAAIPTVAQWQSCFEDKADVGSTGGGSSAPTGAQVIAALTYVPLNKAGDTMSGKLTAVAPTTGTASINLPPGVAPTSPANGDVWIASTGLFYRNNNATVGPITTPGAGFASLTLPNAFTAQNSFKGVVFDYPLINSNATLTLANNSVCADVSGGGITITTPPNPIPNGWTVSIKDCKRQANGTTHILTIAANGGQTIEGAASVAVTTAGTAINGVWNTNVTPPNLDLF